MLETLTDEQYEAVKKAICPYCAIGMPNTRACGKTFYHAIPDDPEKRQFDCLANKFREKRCDVLAGEITNG